MPWYDQRGWALLLALVALLAAYFIGSRALDTGSWQQYGLTLLCVALGLNKFLRSAKPKKVTK